MTAGPVAVAAEPRVPLAPPLRLEPPGGAAAGQARAVGRRLRRGEPGRLHRDHRVHRQVRPTATRSTRARSSSSSSRTRSSPCRSSPRSCRRMSGRWTDRRHRRAAHAVLARGPRHDRRHRARRRSATSALAVPIVSLLLQHGRADASDAENIARTLQAFAVGLPFFSAFQLLTRTFYAMQDTRTPALVNVGGGGREHRGEPPATCRSDWGVPGLALGPRHVVRVRHARVPGGAPEAAGHGSTGPGSPRRWCA